MNRVIIAKNNKRYYTYTLLRTREYKNMSKIKNVLLCGLGAIGSIYAVKTVQNPNVKLKVLIDNSRLNRYKKEPITFNEKEYSFDYITPMEQNFKADLIILATKNNGFQEALNNIKEFVKKDTIIISLLNGLKSEDDIANMYGKDKLLYCYYIGHTSTRINRKIIHDDVYNTVFGEKNNETYSQNVIRLKEFFEESNINYEIPVDMNYSRWWKFLVNIGYNQASAVLNANYGDFQKSEKINNIAIKLMEEAALVAKAEGVKNTENIIPEVLTVIEKMLPETRTSMLQDIDSKRKTEIDIFAKYVCELGEKHNIKTPYNNMFYELIKAMEDKFN